MNQKNTPTHRRNRGMSLVEIMIVMAVFALIVGAVVSGSSQTSSARLKHGGAMLAGAVRVAYSLSSSSGKPVRLVMDFHENTFWLEASSQPMLVASKDPSGAGGANPTTEAEREARSASQAILTLPSAPPAMFKPIEPLGLSSAGGSTKGPRKLPRSVAFRKVYTAHDEAPHTEGRSYLYFWPGGMTEKALIQLKVGDNESPDDAMSLLVSPLTGKVKLKAGASEWKTSSSDEEASEREAPSGF